MTKLTDEQISFLKLQNISLSLVFDATNLSKTERNDMMDRYEKRFYYGGAPCKKGGHTLRSKAGHCIQCNTSNIAFQTRNSAPGYVYLLHSPSLKYVKVGYSQFNPREREEILCNEAYGGISDWEVENAVYFEKDAGKKEFAIHAKLAPFLTRRTYKKERGGYIECRELFKCDLVYAKSVFDEFTSL